MITLKRFANNPILAPNPMNEWEKEAAFNGCPILDGETIHLLYRAMSGKKIHEGAEMSVSTIGHAISRDGINFGERGQFIKPENDWEKYGCEDARVTKIDDKYFIFYTALSNYPFNAEGIKVALAITKDFKTIEAKHLVTPFNAKAMSLFPGRVNGKLAAILTANTDMPPSKIAIATFDNEEQIWSADYWKEWYANVDNYTLTLQRASSDHVEVGAPPILTSNGWLLIYSYIRNYFTGAPVFGIEAVLLDLNDPRKIVGRTTWPLLIPEMKYEKEGMVPNIAFPSGAFVKGGRLFVGYGGADTVSCMASCELSKLLAEMKGPASLDFKLNRYEKNPILKPKLENAWEAKAVFNPGVLYLDGKVHIFYRAMSNDNVSTIGYATSANGYDIDKQYANPVYVPRAPFEKMGCEDPRLTVMGQTIYMLYTAFDGCTPPRVALTSISLQNFRKQLWKWSEPVLISVPGKDDKDACIFPGKIKDKFVFLHRLDVSIDIDFVINMKYPGKKWLGGNVLMNPRDGMWDSDKIGISGPPIKTPKGWLLLYHGVSKYDHKYRVGAALLDAKDPTKILARTNQPILEPEIGYEINGQVRNVVFPCGAAIINDKLFVYYGGADSVIGVATVPMTQIFSSWIKASEEPKNISGVKRSIKKTLAKGHRTLGKGKKKTASGKPIKHRIKKILNYKIF